ncbi:threonine ammonia-lyase IlvA [Neomegalonema sp.]|uniref:threonine ammonia-lyase IlvA n=1 Tax=Neomegalonema sp. TaxID=2039713 RepID=UPI00262D1946|nr:threonine ammonia-lyase IlvA [Neomegalonema sp.]MDD2870209.1 threonine ammonia-lyase IlvA [Neomegalonema sp.]
MTASPSADSISDFRARVAASTEALRKLFPATPLQRNAYLSEKIGATVYLKREDLSPVRSYKLRGAFTFMRKHIATAGKGAHFCAASAGNHAQGFAMACQHFGAKGRIFMPVTTPKQKIEKTKMFGGDAVDIVLTGDFFDECYAAAKAYAASGAAEMAPPFDDADVIEGQATIGLEIEGQMGGKLPDVLIAPVGGGGLAAGLTRFFEGREGMRLRFAEPLGAAGLHASLKAGRLTKLPRIDGFADGAAVAEIGTLNFEILKRHSPQSVTLCPEGRLCQTMLEMLNVEGVVLEPAGALSIDALRDLREELRGKTVVAVVSGGNFDFERLPDVRERALRFEGKKKYFILRLPQRPGALRDFLDLLGPDDDIARFEYLKKTSREYGSILLGVETGDAQNFRVLMERFAAKGVKVEDITDDQLISDLIV